MNVAWEDVCLQAVDREIWKEWIVACTGRWS